MATRAIVTVVDVKLVVRDSERSECNDETL
jgi:hypothetical protein